MGYDYKVYKVLTLSRFLIYILCFVVDFQQLHSWTLISPTFSSCRFKCLMMCGYNSSNCVGPIVITAIAAVTVGLPLYRLTFLILPLCMFSIAMATKENMTSQRAMLKSIQSTVNTLASILKIADACFPVNVR